MFLSVGVQFLYLTASDLASGVTLAMAELRFSFQLFLSRYTAHHRYSVRFAA